MQIIELTEKQLKDISNGEEVKITSFVLGEIVIRHKPVFEDDTNV